MAAVVNQSVLKMADDKTVRTMPTHFLLGGEIKNPEELEHADFLLTDHPKAEQALDLLLGTQGWRRFALENLSEFRKSGEAAEELLLAMGVDSPMPTSWKSGVQDVFDQYWPKYQSALGRLQFAEGERATTDPFKIHDYAQLQRDTRLHQSQLENAAKTLYPIDKEMRERRTYLPISVLLLLGLGVGALYLRRLTLPQSPLIGRSLRFAAVSFILFGSLALLMFVGSFDFDSQWKQAVNVKQFEEEAIYPRSDAMAMKKEAAPVAKMAMPEAGKKLEEMRMFGMAPKMDKPQLMEFEAQGRGMLMPAPAMRAGMAQNKMMLKKEAENKPQRLAVARPREEFFLQDQAVKRKADAKDRAMGLEAAPQEDFLGGRLPMPGEPMWENLFPQELSRRLSTINSKLDATQKANQWGLLSQVKNEITRMIPRTPPVVIREYAHLRPKTVEEDATRSDFAETLLWQPVLVTPETGEATLHLELSDSINGYQLLIAGHTLDGRIGAVTGTIQVRKPFAIDPKLPQEISSGDTIEAPIMLTNATDKSLSADITLGLTGLRSLDGETLKSSMAASKGDRKFVRLAPTIVEGELAVQLDANAGKFNDSIRRTLRVVPDGFPLADEYSTKLKGQSEATVTFPKVRLPRTDSVTVTMYPNTLAELQAGLDGLLREPSGCFEQSSTTNYPNVLIAEYLRETDQARPELAKRVQTLMDNGYGKLTSFECPRTGEDTPTGYEWFGAKDSPHESLTAYGLMQFTDMSRVYPVDPKMLARTKTYLIDSRDGNGGFKRNSRALDSFGRAPETITNAYIVWSITEAELKATTKPT